MKRLVTFLFMFSFISVFPSYASSSASIPPAPTVQSAEYSYFAIFYNTSFNGYYIQYSSSPISVTGNSIVFVPSNSSRFYWSPKDNYEDWVQSSSTGGSNLDVVNNKYIGGNCDIKDTFNKVIYAQCSTTVFIDHVVSAFPAYSRDWTDPVFSGSGGGGIIDISGIISGLKNLLNGILSLPEKIASLLLDGIKLLFIPSEGFLQEKVDFVVNKFKTAFGITPFDMSFMFSSEKSFSDIEINIMGASGTIVDTSYLIDAISGFRKIIRGFIALLLVFYNINQFLGIIGQAPVALGAIIGLGGHGSASVRGGDFDDS